MSISVVIPTKDRLHSLQRVLPNYLSQPETAEVVVVIDGSTDGTLEFLRTLAASEDRIRYIDNGRNRGVPYSKNAGIGAARSAYIFVGEDDVELSEGFFATLLEHLHTSDADVICGRNIWRYERESAEMAIERTDAIPGPSVDLRLVGINTSVRLEKDTIQPLIASPMLARAEIFRQVNFDERYRVNFWREESDFQLSAQEVGHKLLSCPHAICFNYMLENDRGGVHASIGWKRMCWVAINNWRFASKHAEFIARHFTVGSRLGFETRTIAAVFRDEMLVPALVRAKRRVLTALRGPGAS